MALNLQSKMTKIRILGERAKAYNDEREKLKAEGKEDEEIDQILKEKELQKTMSTIQGKILPFQEDQKVIRNYDALNMGLTESHLRKTTYQELNEKATKKFEKYKETKARTASLEKAKLAHTEKEEELAEEAKKQEKKKRKLELMKQTDQRIREQCFKDHMVDLIAMDTKITKSNYGENFEFNDAMQNLCDAQTFDHHMRKNDLKWYAEAQVKYKGTHRK